VLLQVPDPGAPRIALLTPRWASGSEAAWCVRQIAGALACSAEVHVVTTEGCAPRSYEDGILHVHEIATAPAATTWVKHELLRVADERRLRATRDAARADAGHSRSGVIAQLLHQANSEVWRGCDEVLLSVRPDLVLVADHRQTGAVSSASRFSRGVPLVLVPLLGESSPWSSSAMERALESSRVAIAFTEWERAEIAAAFGDVETHTVSVARAANPSYTTEPHPVVVGEEYVLVVSGSRYDDENDRSRAARLVAASLRPRCTVVVAQDRLTLNTRAETLHGDPVRKSADMGRLIGAARAVVDLRPGRIAALRCIDALRHGTPLVVPSNEDVACEHARLGRAGTWFSDTAELFSCVTLVLDDAVHATLGEQGSRYASQRHGSTDAFVGQVALAAERALELCSAA
jgi:hypothetical protein